MDGDVQGRNVLFENEQRRSVVDGVAIKCSSLPPRNTGAAWEPRSCDERLLSRLFQLELGFVFFQKSTEIVSLVKQPRPLLEIKRDGEASQAINANAAFFADAELQRSCAFGCDLLLQFSKAGFHLFISRFCHCESSGGFYNKENQNLTTETRRKPTRLKLCSSAAVRTARQNGKQMELPCCFHHRRRPRL